MSTGETVLSLFHTAVLLLLSELISSPLIRLRVMMKRGQICEVVWGWSYMVSPVCGCHGSRCVCSARDLPVKSQQPTLAAQQHSSSLKKLKHTHALTNTLLETLMHKLHNYSYTTTTTNTCKYIQ